MQNYHYVKSFGVLQLTKKDVIVNEIENYKKFIDNDIEYFKKSSISNILRDTPEYFMPATQFHDWESAMAYLDKLNNIRMGH